MSTDGCFGYCRHFCCLFTSGFYCRHVYTLFNKKNGKLWCLCPRRDL
ncbi:SWIM zinc finger family protein [Sediminibacillus sp. JSM 1682029]